MSHVLALSLGLLFLCMYLALVITIVQTLNFRRSARRTVARSAMRPMPTEVRRAYDQLYASLNTTQRRTFTRYSYFDVRTNLGHKYRIVCHGDFQGNIFRITESGGFIQGYCCHISIKVWREHAMPVFDHYLAQAMMLRVNEDLFLSTAIRM